MGLSPAQFSLACLFPYSIPLLGDYLLGGTLPRLQGYLIIIITTVIQINIIIIIIMIIIIIIIIIITITIMII